MLEKYYREYDIHRDYKVVQKEVNQRHDAKTSKTGLMEVSLPQALILQSAGIQSIISGILQEEGALH